MTTTYTSSFLIAIKTANLFSNFQFVISIWSSVFVVLRKTSYEANENEN